MKEIPESIKENLLEKFFSENHNDEDSYMAGAEAMYHFLQSREGGGVRSTDEEFERDLGNFTYGQLQKNTRLIGKIDLNSGEVSPSTDKERIAEQEAQVKELTRMEGINWVHYQDQTSQLAAKTEEAKTYREALIRIIGLGWANFGQSVAKEALNKYPKP